MSEEEVLENYPDLEKEDVRACIRYCELSEEEVGILEASAMV